MKTTALIEKGRNGYFCVFTPDIDATIIGEGRNAEEAIADFKNSVNEIIASYTEDNEPLPAELDSIEFEYRYDIASIFNNFDFLNITKFAKWAGIDARLMRQYTSKNASISEKQAKKIEKALHKVAQELASDRL